MDAFINRGLPRQRLSYKQKTKKWRKENVDNAERFSLYNNEGVRNTLENRIKNTLLYSGIVVASDMALALNPNNISAEYIPDKVPHHPVMAPKLDVLIGEEINREFDYEFTTISPDAVSAKQSERRIRCLGCYLHLYRKTPAVRQQPGDSPQRQAGR